MSDVPLDEGWPSVACTVVDRAGDEHPDHNGFVVALAARAVRRSGSAVPPAWFAHVESCRRPGGGFGFWPLGRQPAWAPDLPTDADDTAVALLELVRAGRTTHDAARTTACRTIASHRLVSPPDPGPPWLGRGTFTTWHRPGAVTDLVDLTALVNVLALLADLGLLHLPGVEASIATIERAAAWPGTTPTAGAACRRSTPSPTSSLSRWTTPTSAGSPASPTSRPASDGSPHASRWSLRRVLGAVRPPGLVLHDPARPAPHGLDRARHTDGRRPLSKVPPASWEHHRHGVGEVRARRGRGRPRPRRHPVARAAPGDEAPPPPNLLTQSSVTMTVFAQDPMVVDARGCPVLARVSVPADRLQRGPRSHRLHVVDLGVGTNVAVEPVVLHDRSAWSYVDRWDDEHRRRDARALADDRDFRAQNVFAVASHTLSLFEQHLGRPIPWNSHFPQLYLVPQARVEANAFYSREHNAVLFGWLPGFGDKPALYTALSYDVIAHEVSHAILDGLRPRYTEPGLPDQLAFHEALADLVALLSVFGTTGVAQHLLDPEGVGEVRFPSDAAARRLEDPEEQRERLLAGRADLLRSSPLARLAEQIGGRRNAQHPGGALVPGRYPALRRSSTSSRRRPGPRTRRTPSRTAARRSWSRPSCRRWSRCGPSGSPRCATSAGAAWTPAGWPRRG